MCVCFFYKKNIYYLWIGLIRSDFVWNLKTIKTTLNALVFYFFVRFYYFNFSLQVISFYFFISHMSLSEKQPIIQLFLSFPLLLACDTTFFFFGPLAPPPTTCFDQLELLACELLAPEPRRLTCRYRGKTKISFF